jgi:hypothetical protein
MTTKPYRPVHQTLEEALAMQRQYGIRSHQGYIGMFTTQQAKGAIPNGQRIEKVAYEKGDHNPLYAQGTVLGSAKLADRIFYFVEWDASPHVAVGVVEYKIAAVDGGKLAR